MKELILDNKDGSKEKVEIVMTFRLEKFANNDYVIYKNDNKYFAARYVERGNSTILDADLSNSEKVALTKIFDELYERGKL